MKNLFVILFLINSVFAQDARQILSESYEAVKQIESGSYDMEFFWQPMSGNKPYNVIITTEFLKEDTETNYNYKLTYKEGNHFSIYTGDEIININYEDSTATILNKEFHVDYIADRLKSYRLFKPILNPDSFYEKCLSDSVKLSILDEEKERKEIIIKIDFPNMIDDEHGVKAFNNHQILWIDSNSYLPIRLDHSINIVMNNDSMLQVHSYNLKKYVYNNLFNQNHFSIESIPSHFTIRDYMPEEMIPLMSNGTTAPEWSLKDIEGNEHSLRDYHGKIVLLDFFYRTCFGCRKALPFLNRLNEKYQNRGLHIIGVNPVDKDIKELKSFLQKYSVTYSVLLSEKNFPHQYNVMAYPTLYLIDKNGKIVFSKAGYHELMEKELEEIILKYL